MLRADEPAQRCAATAPSACCASEFERCADACSRALRGRLRASGVSLDQADLEACYAQAWQGLYAAMLDGRQIANPAGWLMLVTFRRAIEEHRARARAAPRQRLHAAGAGGTRTRPAASRRARCASERDLAAELDDRMRLRQLFEGLRGRLDGREREAATLCYLQGLSRAQAAARMGVSDARMRKLMEGHGPGRPGRRRQGGRARARASATATGARSRAR